MSFQRPIIKRKPSDPDNPPTRSIQTEPPKFQFGRIQTFVPEWLQQKWTPGERQTEGLKLPKLSLGDVKTEAPWKKKTAKPNTESYTWLRIVPRDGEKYENSKLLKLLSSADNGSFCWRYFCDDTGKLQIHIGCQPKSVVAVKKAVETVFGQVDVEEMSDDVAFDAAAEGYMKRVGPLGRGLKTKADKAIEDLLLNLKDGACNVSITFTKASESERKQMLRSELSDKEPGSRSTTDESIWDILKPWKEEKKAKPVATKSAASKESVEQKAKRKAIEQELLTSELYFNVQIHIQASGEHAKSIVSSVAGVLDTSLRDGHRLILDDQVNGKMIRSGAKGAFAANDVPLWKESELLTVVGLPDMTHRVAKRIPSLKAGQRRLSDTELTEGIAVGYLHHPTQAKRLVKIPYRQFLKHFFLSGKTGTGKSSTLVQMDQSIIDDWLDNPDKTPGFTFIDPAKETLLTLLNRLLYAELQGKHVPWEKVHYFTLAPTDYPVGLNLLHRGQGESPSDIASGTLDLLKYAYGGDTPRMDRLLKNAVLTLLEAKEEHNILGVLPVLVNETFRSSIQVRDPMVRQFWATTGKEISGNAMEPLLNRLNPITGDEFMRNMFGQNRWIFEIRKWMDEGHVVLIDIKNKNEKNMKLIGGHLINCYHAEAICRPADISRPHILMIDEAHLVQVPVLPVIIAFDRKFGLSLGLITQYAEQLTDTIAKAINGNVDTILSCKQGAEAAKKVAIATGDLFESKYLQNLPERTVAVYTSVKNESGRSESTSFTVESDPPVIYMPDGTPADYNNSREMEKAQNWAKQKALELQRRDVRTKEEVEREITIYLSKVEDGMYENEGEASQSSKSVGFTEDEYEILNVITEWMESEKAFQGTTKDLYQIIKKRYEEEGMGDKVFQTISLVKFGILITKAEAWFEDQGITINKSHSRNGNLIELKIQ